MKYKYNAWFDINSQNTKNEIKRGDELAKDGSNLLSYIEREGSRMPKGVTENMEKRAIDMLRRSDDCKNNVLQLLDKDFGDIARKSFSFCIDVKDFRVMFFSCEEDMKKHSPSSKINSNANKIVDKIERSLCLLAQGNEELYEKSIKFMVDTASKEFKDVSKDTLEKEAREFLDSKIANFVKNQAQA